MRDQRVRTRAVWRGMYYLVEGVWRVDGVKLFGGIFAGILENDLLSSRAGCNCQWRGGCQGQTASVHLLFGQKLGDIIGLAVHNDPARVFRVVGGDGGACEFRHCVDRGERERCLEY